MQPCTELGQGVGGQHWGPEREGLWGLEGQDHGSPFPAAHTCCPLPAGRGLQPPDSPFHFRSLGPCPCRCPDLPRGLGVTFPLLLCCC